MNTQYKYGASYNCTVGGKTKIGLGAQDATTPVEFVSNDLDKLKQVLLAQHAEGFAHIETHTKLCGAAVDVGYDSEVIAVLVDEVSFRPLAVIFDMPYHLPSIVS